MRIRVVVADQAEASFYDLQHRDDPPQLTGHLTDPLARLHDRDLISDRPGRKFDHAPLSGGRRGATAHHATGGEESPRRQEAVGFAHRIAAQLERAQRDDEFDRLVVMAPPGFLGVLRKALPQAVRASVVAEVDKDLVHQTAAAVRSHLPDEAFRIPLTPAG